MKSVIVYAPERGEKDFAVWVGDCIEPGRRIALCPTRAVANKVARIWAVAHGQRAVPLQAPSKESP